MLPIFLVSSKSRAYRSLVSAGGPPGRNCDGAAMTHGTMEANCGPAPGANAGGVGRHVPTTDAPRNGGGAGANPSPLRHARISFATVWPHSTPAAMAALDSWVAMIASDTASLASNVAFCAG